MSFTFGLVKAFNGFLEPTHVEWKMHYSILIVQYLFEVRRLPQFMFHLLNVSVMLKIV